MGEVDEGEHATFPGRRAELCHGQTEPEVRCDVAQRDEAGAVTDPRLQFPDEFLGLQLRWQPDQLDPYRIPQVEGGQRQGGLLVRADDELVAGQPVDAPQDCLIGLTHAPHERDILGPGAEAAGNSFVACASPRSLLFRERDVHRSSLEDLLDPAGRTRRSHTEG